MTTADKFLTACVVIAVGVSAFNIAQTVQMVSEIKSAVQSMSDRLDAKR